MNKFCLIALLFTSLGTSAQAQSVDWQVSDRFRLWDRARSGPHVISLEQFLDKIAEAKGPTAVEDAMLQFLATQSDLHTKAYWRKDLETYDREYLWPTSYRVRVIVSGVNGECAWSTSAGVFEKLNAPCAEPVELTVPSATHGRGSVLASVTVKSFDFETTIPIQVQDRLIASIGDSFASGEGNPDIPMDARRLPREFAPSSATESKAIHQGWTAYRFVKWNKDWTDRWLGREDVVGFAGGADWWDPRCHRSFYSQHMVAALRYSAARPKQATTFISYACSGAETFEGLLVRQSTPPGYRDGPRFARLKYPQVEVLVANLCAPRVGPSAAADRRREYVNLGKRVSDQTWRCADGTIARPIDALLVTDGGNDIGFGPVIQDSLLPTVDEVPGLGKTVLEQIRKRGTRSAEVSNEQISRYLPDHFTQLRKRLSQVLAPNTPVLQSIYPNPLFDENGKICAGLQTSNRLAAISGFWPDRHVDPELRWKMNITEKEATDAQTLVVNPLNEAVRKNVDAGAPDGWRLVDAFELAFGRRGWCSSSPLEPSATLPNWDPEQGRWTDWSPTVWWPYASRTRLFRTPNDAAMTQQPNDPRRLLGSIAPVLNKSLSEQQESLLSAMSGSFHPTFQAHAIMGWSVGDKLMEALPPSP